jgi:hypothetical protein
MATFPVSGAEIPAIDLRKMTHKQWRSLFDPTQSEEDADAIVARVSGLSVEEVGELNFYDFRALFSAITDKAGKPLDESDPKN